MTRIALSFAIGGAVVLTASLSFAQSSKPMAWVKVGPAGHLSYDRDGRGNRVPDFSYAGYAGGDSPAPAVPATLVVRPTDGDRTAALQSALDTVASLPADGTGVRGAVALEAGTYRLSGRLTIKSSGVVLRGAGKGRTILLAEGVDRRPVVKFIGSPDVVDATRAGDVADEYVPVGATRLTLASNPFKPGDAIRIVHPSPKAWVSALGMDRFPSKDKGSYLDWKPGTLDVAIDRTVSSVDGNAITLDVPLPMALDRSLATARVVPVSRTGRVRLSGVEHLTVVSATNPTNPADEQHAWTGVAMEHVEDCGVRDVAFRKLAGSAVYLTETCRRVTVADCDSAEPVSERGGYRRHTYYTAGQQTLFLRCAATDGRHDFAVGYLAAGPNAFVRCAATNASAFSGPIESWATGVLYDNVNVDGAGLNLTNRETDGQGVGWAAANSVLWQCVAPTITVRAPPTGHNWAFGVWGQFTGDGHWRQFNEFVKPDSLYEAQLAGRIGKDKATAALAKATPTTERDGKTVEFVIRKPSETTLPKLAVRDGVLAFDGQPLVGSRGGTAWWQGKVLPSRAAEVGIGVTRYVPGREGRGFTDDLSELADDLAAKGTGALDHHYGLWTDRRRDDHQMVRRADGDCWPPFYELPWARSGMGTAWDGLSKYDLTQFNHWYFARLREAADRCAAKKIAFVCQMYFQHNVLEAGAHWADSPWRPANCVQATGFPEPPEYVGGKRIFHAKHFYDVSHPVRRELHRLYIRKVLDTLGTASNVIFQTSEEFTGPKVFVDFWLDTIAEWERETGRRVLVGLSATRDVQDAILADAVRGPRIDVIDLKYWWYSAEGPAYDPPSSTDFAPRQQLREWKGPKGRSDAAVARQVSESRTNYPAKAVTVSHGPVNPWVVLAAGGSIPALPRETETALRDGLAGMTPAPARGDSSVGLARPGERFLIVSLKPGPFTADVSAAKGPLTARWVDPATGRFTGPAATVVPGAAVEFRPPGKGPAVLWLTKT